MFNDATPEEIHKAMQMAWDAFLIYRKKSIQEKAHFMRTIALEIESAGDELILTAMKETNLPEARLRNERGRTIFQLNSYADACEKGDWLEARIDRAIPEKSPPKPDIRKMQVPLGPVVVFGSSNFPFAYSTAGGDTATALAAGCPVIIKAHPAHPQTSGIVAHAIFNAIKTCNMPEGVFIHIYGQSFAVGQELVMHPYTRAVGFTGSYSGGKALYDLANQRASPIPVFAEMGSLNPVILLPQKLQGEALSLAKMLAGSITLGCGQFCTKPGLIFGVESKGLQDFIAQLKTEIKETVPAKMLHHGIYNNFYENRDKVFRQPGVSKLSESSHAVNIDEGLPTIAVTDGSNFLTNPLLHQEVFGPYSLVIACKDLAEMQQVIDKLEGQLTATLMATDEDISGNRSIIDSLQHICGRLIYNGVPTGVEVCLSMQHGGPFPSSTDSRFTSVGADAIKRFVRPISFQNCPDQFLPDALKESNPWGVVRTEN